MKQCDDNPTFFVTFTGSGGSTTRIMHNSLYGRDQKDAHPISAITDLEDALEDLETAPATEEMIDKAFNAGDD